MPPATKRKKIGGVSATKDKGVAPSMQHGIRAFGKISKSQPGGGGKSFAKISEKQQLLAVAVPEPSTSSGTSKKRKARDDETGNCTVRGSEKRPKVQTTGTSQAVNGTIDNPLLRSPRKAVHTDSIATGTPTKGARSFLETPDLSSSPSTRLSSSPPPSRTDTPASSPISASASRYGDANDSDLPEELQDLINLHAAFLTALSLHYAHNGTLTPADFRLLRPNIERSWGKRKVSIEDIQRSLAIQNISTSPTTDLSPADYGHSKICIEISAGSASSTPQRRPLNEEQMNKTFAQNLLKQWHGHIASSDCAEDFIHTLPLLPVKPCTSATTLAPLLAKGQRRLQDLKAGAIKAQRRSQPPPTKANNNVDNPPSDTKKNPSSPIPPSKDTATTASRTSSLFSRIAAKQALATASSSTPLTSEQLLRLSALRRIDEIVPVLELLSSSSTSAGSKAQVQTFTMPTIVQHLQMSLRNPVENDVAMRAVRALAEEVAASWVGVREVGKVVGVTVRKGGLCVCGGREGVRNAVGALLAKGQ